MSVECDGTIKIVKRENVGNRSQYWDSVGTNSWARPASLNTYLNGTYYNSLTSIAQSQVVAHDFSVGLATYNNNDLATQITSENGTKWNGKIALATVSEYLRTNSNMSNCGTYSLYVNNFNTCKTMTWLFDGSNDWWTLSADGYISSDNSNGLVNYITDYGVLTSKVAGDMTNAISVLYLSSAITITDGDGTQSNPFTLG